ncbi:hypothetical protein [Vibrio sp. H11]|uniref:hypothetical protein n=1 Tax=Vibrio sp. H11 TaxID=2565928 RepID=UPI0010A63B3F|nr:hypothetical protein [Vibrio sp. H11]
MINEAITTWLQTLTGLDVYWLKRPESSDECVVYHCLSPGVVSGNLRSTGIAEDVYSFSVYHSDPDQGKAAAATLTAALSDFTGELNPGTPAAYPIQLASFSGGSENWMNNDTGLTIYRFTRDFTINH